MWDWINWGEIETAEMSYHDAFYILSILLIFTFLSLSSIDIKNVSYPISV